MRSPLTRAHPAHVSVFLLFPPTPAQEFAHLDGHQTRRRSPPVGLTTDRGRGSKPRGGTAAWTLPRRRRAPHGLREGGLLPLASTGGESRPPPPLAPRISHPPPPHRMPSPHISLSKSHHLTLCSACSLVGAAPVSRPHPGCARRVGRCMRGKPGPHSPPRPLLTHPSAPPAMGRCP